MGHINPVNNFNKYKLGRANKTIILPQFRVFVHSGRLCIRQKATVNLVTIRNYINNVNIKSSRCFIIKKSDVVSHGVTLWALDTSQKGVSVWNPIRLLISRN